MAGMEEDGRDDQPAGARSARRRIRPARPRRCRLSDRRQVARRGRRSRPTSATSWPTASRRIRVRASIGRSWRHDPHAVVEGLALAAYAVGARRAYIAIRERSTLARQRLETAVRLAEEQGYIGSDALGTGVDVHIEVVALPGGMVVGEETTLLRAIQNKRAQPDQRPPYPSEKGPLRPADRGQQRRDARPRAVDRQQRRRRVRRDRRQRQPGHDARPDQRRGRQRRASSRFPWA